MTTFRCAHTACLCAAAVLTAWELPRLPADEADPPAGRRPRTEIRHPENGQVLRLFPQAYSMHPGQSPHDRRPEHAPG